MMLLLITFEVELSVTSCTYLTYVEAGIIKGPLFCRNIGGGHLQNNYCDGGTSPGAPLLLIPLIIITGYYHSIQ